MQLTPEPALGATPPYARLCRENWRFEVSVQIFLHLGTRAMPLKERQRSDWLSIIPRLERVVITRLVCRPDVTCIENSANAPFPATARRMWTAKADAGDEALCRQRGLTWALGHWPQTLCHPY
jgi:hypothetical protein